MIVQYKPQYSEIEAKELYNLVMSGSYLADFKKTEEFEKELCIHTGNTYVHAVNNGTVAISLALLASEKINDCSQVIVPNLTMIATANAVLSVGAHPVFCDIEPETLCLDVDKALEICKNTDIDAIIYVTLNGRINLKKYKELRSFCKNNNILLIKDDAQSLGSFTDDDLQVTNGIYSDMSTVSFSPHKIISCGQGGAVLTNDKKYADNIARLKDFGRLSGGADIHDYYGTNSKFTEMQATIGLCQLERLSNRISTKRRIYEEYYKHLSFLMLKLNKETPWFIDIYFSTERLRDGCAKFLLENEIQTRSVYPALTSQKIYQNSKPYKIAEFLGKTGLWLPSSFDLTDKEIEHICNLIKGYLS